MLFRKYRERKQKRQVLRDIGRAREFCAEELNDAKPDAATLARVASMFQKERLK